MWDHRAGDLPSGINVRHALPTESKVAPVVDLSKVAVDAGLRIGCGRLYYKDENDSLVPEEPISFITNEIGPPRVVAVSPSTASAALVAVGTDPVVVLGLVGDSTPL
jgi:hypothetical protein